MQVPSTSNATLDAWDKYLEATDDLNQTTANTVISLKLTDFMGTNLNRFYRYNGSLTTPPCTQAVIWTVFEQPIMLNDDELQNFRKYLYAENFREPQPLNGRPVFRNFLDATMTNISDYQCCTNNSGTNPGAPSSTSSIHRRSTSVMNLPILTYSTLLIVISFLLI